MILGISAHTIFPAGRYDPKQSKSPFVISPTTSVPAIILRNRTIASSCSLPLNIVFAALTLVHCRRIFVAAAQVLTGTGVVDPCLRVNAPGGANAWCFTACQSADRIAHLLMPTVSFRLIAVALHLHIIFRLDTHPFIDCIGVGALLRHRFIISSLQCTHPILHCTRSA